MLSSIFNHPYDYISPKGKYNLSFIIQPETADIEKEKK